MLKKRRWYKMGRGIYGEGTLVKDRLSLVCVFAHPDDFIAEGVLARAKTLGWTTYLVCATGGEAGRVKNNRYSRPADDLVSIKQNPIQVADML